MVQKHDASRLHYDFRLELDGVLKSWAVPKGPSQNPNDKRLAIQVEDHPLEYRTFEGIIPAGNYGAGSVIVWDEGVYSVPGQVDTRGIEEIVRQGLQKGHLRLVLFGKKLRGEFSLVKIAKGEKNSWLLVKKRDDHASQQDIREEDRSVRSGRSLQEIAGNGDRKPARASRSRRRRFSLDDATTAEMPHDIRPMLASLVEAPFDRKGWLFEVKWDGYRAIAEVAGGDVRLYSRSRQPFEKRFARVVQFLRSLGHDAVLDGEIVVVDEQGKSRFQLLQNFQKTGQGRLAYYVFDLLYLDGHDLRDLPLLRRKELLRQLVEGVDLVRPSEHILEHGIAFFRAAVEQGLEGIIAKDAASPYREGTRSHEWLKIKDLPRQEAVIGGFTEPRGSRKNLGALVLGVYDGDELVYIGHTGGGFDSNSLQTVHAKLMPLIQDECPFTKRPRTNAPVRWVEPRLVCEVRFQEWTDDGRMRQPIFLGLREDKPAQSVRRERPVSNQSIAEGKSTASNKGNADRAVVITNPDKIYWPDEGYTKADLVAYYKRMADLILPYLRDRPLSLHRHPNGIKKPSFFQKDVGKQPPPSWVTTAKIESLSNTKVIRYLLCQDEPTLRYLANLGCIELNPWNSRMASLERPDYLVLDLDPQDIAFAHVVTAALEVRRVLDQAGADSFCKTSGQTGLHIYVPLGARYTYEQARQFAELLAQLVHRRLPDTTSLERSPSRRPKKIYLDYLQNRRGQTLAAPYSVRPVSGATVSTPLRWREVTRRLDPKRFTIKNLPTRVDKVGDLWAGTLQTGIDLHECLQQLLP